MARYTPTEEHRKLIGLLAERGLPLDDMVLLLNVAAPDVVISVAQLRRQFDHELKVGGAKKNLAIAERINKSADSGNVAAQIFMAKVHLGWQETKSSKAKAGDAPTDVPGVKADQLPTLAAVEKIFRIPRKSSRRS